MNGIMTYKPCYKRYVTEREAADYLGMTLAEFRRDCTVPPIERAQGRKVWDIQAVDRWSETPRADHDTIIAKLKGAGRDAH